MTAAQSVLQPGLIFSAGGQAAAENTAVVNENDRQSHIVSEHEAVDDAETMYRRAMAFAAAREPNEFRAELSDLRDQLRLVAERERFTIKNIL